MAVDSFEEFLKKKNKGETPIDWDLRKKDWIKSINKFYQSVGDWLSPFVKNSLLNIDRKEVELYEQHIGHYTAPRLDIRIANDIISLTPKGTMVLGGYGRIDMNGPKKDIILLEEKWNDWKFISRYGTGDLEKVSATSFQKAIQEVING
jgi:hypothetical protein